MSKINFLHRAFGLMLLVGLSASGPTTDAKAYPCVGCCKVEIKCGGIIL